jgi:hypothetical protein
MSSPSRFHRIFATVALVTMIAWAGAWVFSALAGETPKQALKKIKFGNQNLQTVSQNEEFAIDGVETLSIEAGAADIKVTASPTAEKFQVEYKGMHTSPTAFEARMEGSRLVIKTKKREGGGLLNFNLQWDDETDNVLRIMLPTKFARALELNSGAGDVTLADLSLEKLHIEAAAGDIELVRGQTVRTDLKSSSGDVTIHDFNGDLDIKTTAGDLSVDKYQGDKLDIKSTSGDIAVSDLNAQQVKIAATAGDVEVKLADGNAWHFDLNATAGDISNSWGNSSDGTKRMEIDTTSGDITITR